MKYSTGSYNKFDDKEQWIRITEGCPNGCEFCYETKVNGPQEKYLGIPDIVRHEVKIMDMNLIYKKDVIHILNRLGKTRVNNKVVYYELICGIDYRFMTQDIALALKRNRFKNIRIAWDHSFKEQKQIKKTIYWLHDAGYRFNRDITVFMICNWKIPYEENLKKLDLCKVWNVKVADCYFDNQLSPNIKPIHWTEEQIKDFRRKVRKHNQLVGFRIDPEVK